jgi:hypothetical protein
MVAHSPPFPLVINFFHTLHDRDITAEDEEGIVFALQQRDRVRRIHFRMPIRNVQRLIMAIDGEYLMLEALVMLHPTGDNSANVILPQTFRAPRLQRLVLGDFAFPTGSPFLATVMGRLVTLRLYLSCSFASFWPNILFQYLPTMGQLETLVICFSFPVSKRDVEKQLSLIPIKTNVELPNLRYFTFKGASAYLEALVCGITTPRLEKFEIMFSNQLTFSLPRLLQFIRSAESLKFHSAEIEFSSVAIQVGVYPCDRGGKWAFRMDVDCEELDWQVSSVAGIFDELSQAFSTVEKLTLRIGKLSPDSEGRGEVVRTEWCRFLSSFGNVKTVLVDNPLEELTRCFQLEGEELPLGMVPEPQNFMLQRISEESDEDEFDDMLEIFEPSSLHTLSPPHIPPSLRAPPE